MLSTTQIVSFTAVNNMITAAQVFVEGNTAVITGASSGIGRATAFTCASKGMHVWLVDIDKEELAVAKDLCIDKCLYKESQVSDRLLFESDANLLWAQCSIYARVFLYC
jgi:NADP-dependent 3-hydroxy acid dehydrogenase YdfG